MSDPPAQVLADGSATRDSIFALVLEYEPFFGDVVGLPDVRGFLEACASRLRCILQQRWIELLPSSSLSLVVNILINPNLLFCHRDAIHGQYSRYFRPVYIDPNAIRIDEGKQSDDDSARAVVELHRTFDRHYDEDLESRPFLSLNDIEALLLMKGSTTPLPAANKVISIWRTGDHSEPFALLSDDSDYWPQVKEALRQSGAPRAEQKFISYLTEVTKHSGSYHHVTIGSGKNWVGRVYLAFRDNAAEPRSPAWIAGVKGFAFDVVAPLALAGTFIRNPGVITMLGDVRELLLHCNETRRRHSSTFDRFFGSATQANRQLFPTIDYVSTTRLAVLRNEKSHSLHQTRDHFLNRQLTCWCASHPDEPLTHALRSCLSAGATFLADVFEVLKGIPAFQSLPDDTLKFLAHALAFGNTEDVERPKILVNLFEKRNIGKEWIETCQRTPLLEQDDQVPKSIRPFIRALLLMVGNHPMVSADAMRLGIRLDCSIPLLTELKREDRNILVKVEYRASGELSSSGTKELDSQGNDALHANNNRLLLHFGKQFLDDFRMSITTTVNLKVLRSTYRWLDFAGTRDGTIAYGFRFSR